MQFWLVWTANILNAFLTTKYLSNFFYAHTRKDIPVLPEKE